MARILYGPLVTSVKGSISGVTFQGNPSGSIIRSRPHLSRVSTNKQTASHASLNNLIYLWGTITQPQRDSWNEYAAVWTKINKFGQSKTLTGLNWFTSLNYWRLLLGYPFFSVPPGHNTPQSPPSFTLIILPESISINFTEAHNFDENPVIVWTSLPTRKNTLSINQVRKLVTVIDTPPADPLDITLLWEAATDLVWSPVLTFPTANIFVCLESVSLSSCITSPMLCTKNQTPSPEDETFYYYL